MDVGLPCRFHTILIFIQSDHARLLDRQEDAVVHVGFQDLIAFDQLCIAYEHPQTGTGHTIRL